MTNRPNQFCGKLVRLATPDLENDPPIIASWSQNSAYLRLLTEFPAQVYSPQQVKTGLENNFNKSLSFTIRTMADDLLIGALELSEVNWRTGNALLGIGIGNPDYWGHGYGSEAINLLLRYAFEALNLRRVTLDVFEYNERAVKAYQKLGFTVEGRIRQMLARDERRWDVIYMGILRPEWEALQPGPEIEET